MLRQQRARRGLNVILAHQRFTDQEAHRATALHAREVGGSLKAAFRDQDAVIRQKFCQTFGRAKVRRESLEIAVVDANQRRGELDKRCRADEP